MLWERQLSISFTKSLLASFLEPRDEFVNELGCGVSNLSENGIYDDPEVAQFYGLANQKRPDLIFCQKLAKTASFILDIGCGTGEFAISIAEGKTVYATDPALPMLNLAKEKTGAEKVNWIETGAEQIDLGKKFDLIVMTGHTFQVFLDSSAQLSVLQTVAKHLKENGIFIFDSRNPDFPENKERRRNEKRGVHEHIQLGKIECWNSSQYNERSQILTYQNGYKVLGSQKEFSAEAKIKYTHFQELENLIHDAGLMVNKCLGDWNGSEFSPQSREIIPIGSLKHET